MTQETEDMVGRLRLFGSARPQLGLPVCDEAADLLERLSDRIDVLEAAVQAVAGAMLQGGDGAVGDFGWSITKLNKARPLIRAALHQEGIEEGSDDPR